MTIKHSFISAVADDPAASAAGEVLASHWNAAHVDANGNPVIVRIILTANQSYYVAVGGSDSANGLTPGTAWATPQHAMDFISSSVDIGGFTITVNVGAGTFAGIAVQSTVGGGIIQFLGVSSASTTLLNPSPRNTINGVIEFNAGAIDTVVAFDQFTIKSTTANYLYYVGVGFLTSCLGTFENFSNGDIVLQNDGTGAITGIGIFINHVLYLTLGTFTVNNGLHAQGFGKFMDLESGANVLDFGNWVFNSPTFTEFIFCLNAVYSTGSSYTGTITGRIFNIENFSAVLGPLISMVTATQSSLCDASSAANEIPGSNVNYQAPSTGFTITLNNTDTDLILDPSGTLANGTVKMAPSPNLDGQKVTIRTSQIITSLVINGNGATVAGYATGTLALGGVLHAIYKASNTTWYF